MIDVEAVQEVEADTEQLARLLEERERSLVELGTSMENVTGYQGASPRTSCYGVAGCQLLCLVAASNGRVIASTPYSSS